MLKKVKYTFITLILTIIITTSCDLLGDLSSIKNNCNQNSVTSIAVGDNNALITSCNGIDWIDRTTALSSIGNFNLNTIDYGKNKWMAAGIQGSNGIIITSSNGIDWSVMKTSVSAKKINAITYSPSKDKWFLVGEGNSTINPGLIIEISASSATSTHERDKILNDVLYYNTILMAVGDGGKIFIENLGTWVEENNSAAGDKLNAIDGTSNNISLYWFAVGNNFIIKRAPNPQNYEWTRVTLNGNLDIIKDIAYGKNQRWLAVGQKASAVANLFYDGTNWQQGSEGEQGIWNGLAYSSNKNEWVTVGTSNGKGYIGFYNGEGHLFDTSEIGTINSLNDIAFK